MPKWKKILRLSLIILSVGVVVFLLGFVNKMSNEQKCTRMTITLDESDQLYFIDQDDIRRTLLESGSSLVGQPLSEIDPASLEKRLRNHPHIETAEVFLTIDGEMKVNVTQRRPILRIINAKDESYYMDAKGYLMPLSDKFAAKVPVANGLIFETYDRFYTFNFSDTTITPEFQKRVVLDDLFAIANYIRKDPFWKAQIQQFYVDKEIELVPRVGDQQIILGDKSDLPEKFGKLKIFYEKAMPKVGWNAYQTINLKYKGQVVCKKRVKEE